VSVWVCLWLIKSLFRFSFASLFFASFLCVLVKKPDRGRNAGYPAPPAQIRSRPRGRHPDFGDFGAQWLADGQLTEATVLGIPDPLLGNRLAALVVPAAGDVSAEDLMHRCAAILPKHKLPATIKFLRTLPKKASGKIDRDKCLTLLK